MLSDLLQVCQGILLPLHDRRHPTQRRPLQLLTSVQRVTELNQANIVFCDLRNEVTSSVELTESELVVVLVVQDVQKV